MGELGHWGIIGPFWGIGALGHCGTGALGHWGHWGIDPNPNLLEVIIPRVFDDGCAAQVT